MKSASINLKCALILTAIGLALPAARAQKLTTLYTFTGAADGAYPSNLIRDAAGNLYGTTLSGGAPTCSLPYHGCGTVFKLDTQGHLTVLYRFTGGADGAYPAGGLIRDAANNLYGTTISGGDLTCRGAFGFGLGCGTLYKLDASGQESVMRAFTGPPDGEVPQGDLVEDADGNFFGATGQGGNCSDVLGCGTVFELDSTGNETVLHAFNGGPDGNVPDSVLRDSSATGTLYGITEIGGAHFEGTVFKLDHTGAETVLHNFSGDPDGQLPNSRLIWNGEHMYGVTTAGGARRFGTVYKIDRSGKESVVYSFQGPPDGAYAKGTLARDPDGNLYGTTYAGGLVSCFFGSGCGTVFKLDTNGVESVVYSFTDGADGNTPLSGVIRDAAGNLYGTTYYGGPYGVGTIFKIEP
jgi:uncharacterized repeat protein (TIGR03803 family)